MNTEQIAISKIKLNPDNPRTITDEKFEQLVQSIKDAPWMLDLRPIVVNDDMMVLGGNMRLNACKKAKLKTIPIIRASELTPEQQREFIIKDNVPFGEWDWDKIDQEWENEMLAGWGFEILTDIDGDYVEEFVAPNRLKPHPQHYRKHPPDQIEHLAKSIEQNGIYRNVVTAVDYTILDGHGLVEAAKLLKMKKLPVTRLNVDADSLEAMKVLVSNNEVGKLAQVDDRQLTQILKFIGTGDEGDLVGTGFDKMKVANLVMVTRHEGEIPDINTAAEWVGMPEYIPKEDNRKITVHFRNEEDLADFFKLIDQPYTEKTTSVWHPRREQEDVRSLKYESNETTDDTPEQ